MSVDDVMHLILIKLVRARIWSGKHTPLNFVIKGLPAHFRITHSGEKAVKQ